MTTKFTWKDPITDLPLILDEKSYRRCICLAQTMKDENIFWDGYIDCYFHSRFGWRRCQDESSDFMVVKWIYIEEFMGEEYVQ